MVQNFLFVYAGEYDFTCPPDHVEESVKQIKGANYKTLKGLGHFSMSEDIMRDFGQHC